MKKTCKLQRKHLMHMVIWKIRFSGYVCFSNSKMVEIRSISLTNYLAIQRQSGLENDKMLDRSVITMKWHKINKFFRLFRLIEEREVQFLEKYEYLVLSHCYNCYTQYFHRGNLPGVQLREQRRIRFPLLGVLSELYIQFTSEGR